MMFWANGSAIKKRIIAEEKNDKRIKALKCRVLSHKYPQRKEAGMEQKMAIEVITPKATSGPPRILVSLKATR